MRMSVADAVRSRCASRAATRATRAAHRARGGVRDALDAARCGGRVRRAAAGTRSTRTGTARSTGPRRCSSSPTASAAARWLRARAASSSRGCTRRSARGRIDADAVRSALLDADRDIGRSIASRTDAPGAATVALCAGTDASLSRWLIAWVGDCRVYRLERGARRAGGAPDRATTPIGISTRSRRRAVRPTIRRAWSATARSTRPTSRSVALAGDEMLVLCSDGVHKHVARATSGASCADGRRSRAAACG